MTRARPMLVKMLLALFACTVLFSRQIAVLSDDENRMFMFWERLDSVALALTLAACALLAVGIDSLLARPRLRGLQRAYRHLFLLALLTPLVPYVLPYLPRIRHSRHGEEILWLVMVLGVAGVYLLKWTRVMEVARSVSLLFSALAPLLLVQMLTWSTFGTPPERPRYPRPAVPGSVPVILVLFDEWSYTQSVRDGRFLPSLPNLDRLAGQAFLFRRAQSEAPYTKRSLPKILYQTARPLMLHGQQFCLAGGATPVPTVAQDSLFSRARRCGYNTAMLGFYLPYRFMLGSGVDYCRAYTFYPTGPGLLAKTRWSLLRNMRYWSDPLSRLEGRPWLREQHVSRWMAVERTVHRDGLRLIRDCPPNTLAFIHEVGAHPPFTFSREAALQGLLGVPDYQRQLERMDGFLGEIVQALRASGKFDRALLIVMSDHAWRDDPLAWAQARPGWQYHIPLLVKWPGQWTARAIDRPFSLIQLQPLIDLAIAGGGEERALKLIGSLPTLPTGKTLDDHIYKFPLTRPD